MKPVIGFEESCAMSQFTAISTALSLVLLAASLSSSLAGAADVAATDETARVIGANDIYRVKIESVPTIEDGLSVRLPIQVYGSAGYYLYDHDAWAMTPDGPMTGALRVHPYSLFGTTLDASALNGWTMRSEYLRGDDVGRNDAGTHLDPISSWSYPGWRF